MTTPVPPASAPAPVRRERPRRQFWLRALIPALLILVLP